MFALRLFVYGMLGRRNKISHIIVVHRRRNILINNVALCKNDIKYKSIVFMGN